MEGRGRGHFLRGSITQSPFHDRKGPGAPRRHQERTGAIHQTQGGEDKRGVGQAGPGGTPRNLRGRWKDARPETSAQQLFSPSLEPCWGKLPATLTARMPSRAVLPRAVPCLSPAARARCAPAPSPLRIGPRRPHITAAQHGD